MNTTVAGTSGLDISYLFTSTLPSLTMMINMILSVPLNGYVIWLILGASRETMASDFFSLNLAFSEFLFALSSIWHLIFIISSSLEFLRIYYFSFALIATGRPLFQSCICVEYYMGVTHPVLYLRFKPLRYRVVCCSVVWLLILLSCIYSFFIDFEYFYYYYLFFIQNVLLFSVMLFCCFSVLRVLKRPGPGDGDTEKRTSNAMKRRAFNIILIIVTCLAINQFVYLTLIPMRCCINTLDLSIIFGMFLNVTLASGFVQPLLFLHRSGKLPCFCRVK